MRSIHDPRYTYGHWAHRLDLDDMEDALYGEEYEREDESDEREDDEELTDE